MCAAQPTTGSHTRARGEQPLQITGSAHCVARVRWTSSAAHTATSLNVAAEPRHHHRRRRLRCVVLYLCFSVSLFLCGLAADSPEHFPIAFVHACVICCVLAGRRWILVIRLRLPLRDIQFTAFLLTHAGGGHESGTRGGVGTDGRGEEEDTRRASGRHTLQITKRGVPCALEDFRQPKPARAVRVGSTRRRGVRPVPVPVLVPVPMQEDSR